MTRKKPAFEWKFAQESDWPRPQSPTPTAVAAGKRSRYTGPIFVELALVVTVALLAGYHLDPKAKTNAVPSEGHLPRTTVDEDKEGPNHQLQRATAQIQTLEVTLTRQTAHLAFSFKEGDRALIESVADQLDELYGSLYRLLALEPDSDPPKVWIVVTPDAPVLNWKIVDQRILVHPPHPTQIAERSAKASMLRQSLRDALISYVWTEAVRQYPVEQRWQLMMNAIQWWLLQTDRLPLALPVKQEVRRVPIDSPQLSKLFFRWGTNWRSYSYQQTEILMAQSLIDYSVQTYGQASLPQLLQALGQHPTWTTLVPAVYHRTAEEFEADWRAYLITNRGECC